MEVKFEPRTSHKSVRMFYGVISLFLVIFIFILPVDKEPMLYAVYGLLLLMLLIVFVQASAFLYGYYINDQGVVLKNYKKRLIPFKEIQRVKLLSGAEVSDLIEAVNSKDSRTSAQLGFMKSMKGKEALNQLTKYCSYQIINQDSKVGRKITKVSSLATGDFVLLVTKQEEVFLLSPQTPEALVKEAQKRIK